MSNKVSVGSSAFAFGVYSSKAIPLEQLTNRLQELNFQGIELLGCRPYGDPDDLSTAVDRRNLKKMFRDHGLEISNYGADFKERSPASSDPDERAGYRKLFTKNLHFCEDCEIPSIRVDTVNEPPLISGVTYEDAWNRMRDTWHECAEEAQKAGVLVVWEFEPGFMFSKPHEVAKMIGDVSHRNFHFKDTDSKGKWKVMGEGACDFKGVIKLLADTGYKGWIIGEEESDDARKDQKRAVIKNRQYLKSIGQ